MNPVLAMLRCPSGLSVAMGKSLQDWQGRVSRVEIVFGGRLKVTFLL